MTGMRRGALLGFAGRFLLVFVLLFVAFEGIRDSEGGRFAIEGLVLMPTVALANRLTPATPVTLQDRSLVSARARLRILRGCEGTETVFLLWAAVLSFPARWPRRLTALLAGTALAYALVLGRLLALLYGLGASAGTFGIVHGLLAPLIPVLVLAAYFRHWARGAAPDTTPIAARVA